MSGLFNFTSLFGKSTTARKATRRSVLNLETLEAKWAPAVFSVENLNDAGPGSLRAALDDANASAGPDGVLFADGLSGTITVSNGPISITDSVEVRGPGANVVTIDAFQTSH